MASEEGEKDEMGSLFEGMVLIDPSLRADDDGGGGGGGGGDDDDQLQEQHQSISFSPHTCRYTSSSPASHPLDENLFTDLTLIIPDSQLPAHTGSSDTSSTSTTTMSNREVSPSSLSRQISTKKKKRAGLKRIGYGRDAPIPPHDQHIDGPSLEFDLSSPPPPLPSLLLTDESESGRSAPHQRRQVHQQEELELEEEEEASLSSTATIKMESDYSETTCSEEADHPSHYKPANGASRDEEDDSVVSDAQPTNRTGVISKDQLKTSAPNAIELRYEQIRAQISQKLRHVRELISSISAARKDSRRRRRKAAETVNIASTRYKQLEKELEEACEAEDFETAERVSESLASAEKDKERLAIGLRHAEEDCDAVDSRMHQVLELQIAAEEECSSLLKNFALVGTISLIVGRGY